MPPEQNSSSKSKPINRKVPKVNNVPLRTMIIGDVNSGKTRLTRTIVDHLIETGHGAEIVLLDLAPETTKGIGGKMNIPSRDILLLTCPIYPPRLTGRDERHIQQLAEQNAAAIDPLIDKAIASGQGLAARRTILIINDASLYLQAGSIERLLTLVQAFPTAIINAYMGESFIPAPFTVTERRNVEHLQNVCDKVIQL